MDLYRSFCEAHKASGLSGVVDEDDFETYLCSAPLADWEDESGSLEWVFEWERQMGLKRDRDGVLG